MNRPRAALEAFLSGRFSVLLISLCILFLIGPLVPGDQGFSDKLFGVEILVVLISCLRAVSRSRRFFLFMALFTLVNVVLGSYELIESDDGALMGSVVLFIRFIYFVMVFFSIMHYVMDRSPVTADKICGAVSAYMIMGIAWAFVYALLYRGDPAAFRVPDDLLSSETVNSIWTLYFSFTTLTTLGYGDITPVLPAAQSYAIMEAAAGQMFVAVIIARLIALQITHRSPDREISRCAKAEK